MKKLLKLVSFAVVASVVSAVSLFAENAVIYWNNQVLNATRLSRNPPPIAALHIATFHAAIFDAVNSIDGAYEGWLWQERAPAGIDRDAAIAGAGYTVLSALWSETSNPRNLKNAFDEALAKIPAGKAKDDGVAWGKKVADAILARRAQSGWNTPVPGQYSSTEQGKWRETPTGFRPPVAPHLAKTAPFAMTSPSQFRAPPPPALGSKEYADELAYVVKVGARDGAERTEYETLSTPFWADDLGTATPAGHWNVVAQDLAQRQTLSTEACARLFALLNFACADAGISCWDSKFFYNTWRPETAIREIDPKVNPHVVLHPEYIPNMEAPAHPDYTSGHSTFTGAATRLLERWFGTDEIEFTTTSDGLPGAVRTFKSLSAARAEVGMSRIFGGIHTMSANLAGQEAGKQIADWTFTQSLKAKK